MLDTVLQSVPLVFEPSMLLAIFLGVVGGLVIGVLPGLTSTMGVALLIPLTFHLPPNVGLAALGAIYVASTYSGSLTATLLNIPGTPAAVATLLDAHPMSKKGESLRAISLSTFSSAVGGIISVLALLFLAPPLAEFSLNFGSIEYFLLSLFGITVIASLSNKGVVLGLVVGAIGLVISSVGMHSLTGYPRFTFGIPSLYDGIPIVISLIGLFSIPEVIDMIKDDKSRNRASELDFKISQIFIYLKENFRHKINLLRSSLIGIVVGIIPGIGSSIGGFISYDSAKSFSKNKDDFGKGNPEGVIAVESANNAVTGGTLIPLLTLGLPGNAVTAVLLGGLLIHGLQPGADLFTDNSDVVYSFILSLFISNIIFVPLGLILARYCIKIVSLDKSIIIMSILTLSILGSYSIRNSVEDIYIMLFMGFIGYLLEYFSVPRAPLVLGLVLGAISESELERSLTLVNGDIGEWFLNIATRPYSLIIVLLCILSLYKGIRNSKKADKKSS